MFIFFAQSVRRFSILNRNKEVAEVFVAIHADFLEALHNGDTKQANAKWESILPMLNDITDEQLQKYLQRSQQIFFDKIKHKVIA